MAKESLWMSWCFSATRLFPIAHEVGMMLSKSFDAKEAVSESLFFAVDVNFQRFFTLDVQG